MKRCLSIAALAFVALSNSPGEAASVLVGQATVIDGDTLEIQGRRIRLFGIDAPESSQSCKRAGKVERCGQAVAIALADRIARQTVRCAERDVDRYGRMVAVCSAGSTELNRWMVENGHAIAYRQYSADYIAVENQARAARRGIWATEFQAPADYRRSKAR